MKRIYSCVSTPVENVANSFHDDYIRENAKFRNDAGLKSYITRYAGGKCCKWCDNLEGKYEYGEEPDDVFRRHDNCRCIVIYKNGRKRQDVWSKKSWEVPETDKTDYKPQVLSREQSKIIEAKNMRYKGIDKAGESGIIEKKKIEVKTENVFSSLETNDKNNANALLGNAPNNIISAVNACDNSFSINPEFSHNLHGSHYNWQDQTVKVLMSEINSDTYLDIGRGNELYKSAYNELFHEIGHAVDNAAGRNTKGGFWATNLSSEFVSPTKNMTLSDSLEAEVVNCINIYGEEKMTKMLQDMPLISSADISDIFGAFTQNKVVGYTGHPTEYWSSDLREKAASECFAEMFSAEINNPQSLENFKKFLPNSYQIFKEIILEIPNINMRR